MNISDQDIKRYENKIKSCSTMTELLVAMSSWQSFADAHALSEDQRASVDQAYIEAESRLIGNVKPSLW